MKKIIFSLLLLTATFALNAKLNAQASVNSKGGGHGGGSTSIPASEVPKAVRVSFKGTYPNARQVEWEYKPVYYGTPVYTASFNNNGQKWEANFSASGGLISAYPKA